MKKSKKFIALCKKHGVDHNKIPEIISFEDACKFTGDDHEKLPVVKSLPPKHQNRIIADYKLSIIAEALRQGKEVDYNNTNQYKYFAVFRVIADKKNPSGFGWAYYDYALWDSCSAVGLRLCFPDNYELAEYFGKQFIKLHEDHHLYT